MPIATTKPQSAPPEVVLASTASLSVARGALLMTRRTFDGVGFPDGVSACDVGLAALEDILGKTQRVAPDDLSLFFARYLGKKP